MPAIAEPGSSAIGFTVSLAPMTNVTSVSLKSSLISSISSTTEAPTSDQNKTPSQDKLTIVGDGCLCQQDVTLAGHAARDGMDSKLDG